MTISSLIARVGSNPVWIAANAHFWFAFSGMLIFHGSWVALAVLLLVAAVKEFWFDATHETTPPQTAMDNITDFIGYAAGAGVGVLIAHT